jgi:GT2 family glycosyltransferase
VVVVDNRPEDSPRRLALWSRLSADGRVSVVAEPRPGSSAARNCGVGVARGEVVAFTDDDVEVESGWLRALGGRFAVEPQTDCVTGLVLPKELETPAQIWFERSGSNLDQHVDLVRFHIDTAGRDRFLGGLRRGRYQVTACREDGTSECFLAYRSGRLGMTASMAIRVDAFHALGGFDEALGPGRPAMTGEDHLLLVRLLFAGRRLTLDPAAYVFHTHRRRYDELLRQMRAYGCGYTAMLTALPRSDPRHLIGLSWYALQAGLLLARKFRSERAPVADYPPDLSKAELRGLLAGPRAYLRSRRQTPRRPAWAGSAGVRP